MAHGNQKVDFTDQKVLDEITGYIKEGYTEGSIAKRYGYTKGHWSDLKKRFPELSDTIKNAKEDIHSLLKGKLFQMSMDDKHPKQFSAIVFLLKTQYGWNDSPGMERETKTTTKLKFTGVEQ